MKKLIFAGFILTAAVLLIAQQIAVMKQFTVVNGSTTVPVQLTNAPITATAVTLYGTKTPQGANVGDVYVSYGQSADGLQATKITSGSFVTLSLQWPGRASFVLSNIWLDVGNVGDGVTVLYDQVQ